MSDLSSSSGGEQGQVECTDSYHSDYMHYSVHCLHGCGGPVFCVASEIVT